MITLPPVHQFSNTEDRDGATYEAGGLFYAIFPMDEAEQYFLRVAYSTSQGDPYCGWFLGTKSEVQEVLAEDLYKVARAYVPDPANRRLLNRWGFRRVTRLAKK